MKKSLIRISLLIFGVNLLAACSILQPPPQKTEPLRVEYTKWWGDYTLVIAKEKGFFDKYGVEVEPVFYEKFSNTYPDLAAGQIDGALIAIGDAININHSAGMKAVAISDDGGEDSIVAAPEITSIQDLKGKKVGVLPGTQYELMISEMLKSSNMNPTDISIVSVDPGNARAALDAKQVQAVFTWEPFSTEAVAAGYRSIYPQESVHLFPNMIVFDRSVVSQRPEDIRNFLKAWFEAVDYREKNPDQTSSIIAKYLGLKVEEVQPDGNLNILTLDDNKVLFDIQSENSIYATTKRTSDYLISIGAVIQQADPLELLDPGYLP